MDIARELFGTSSGWMVIVGMVIMIVGIPATIWRGLGHTRTSVSETADRKVHPGQPDR